MRGLLLNALGIAVLVIVVVGVTVYAWKAIGRNSKPEPEDSDSFPFAVINPDRPRSKWLCRDEHNQWAECKLSGDVIIVDLSENTYTWASPPPESIKEWSGVR